MRRYWPLWLILTLLLALGGIYLCTLSTRPVDWSVYEVAVPDPDWEARLPFAVPVDDGFELMLGRGSGWHGLDVFKIDGQGKATYSLRGKDGLVRWRFVAARTDLQALVDFINANNIVGLGRTYTNPHIADGTQWVLLLKTKGLAKSVYCDNVFPGTVTKLAQFIDDKFPLSLNAEKEVVPPKEPSDEQELWKSIHP